jgi:hypothetical protein
LFWFRQADDTMTAIHRDHVTSFLAFLNAVHEKIKWTYETEKDGRIDMLDLTILRQLDGTLQFDVFRKPTHTNQYISWDSDQPLKDKGSTIRALTRCAIDIPTGPQRQEAEQTKVHQALHLKGYPPWAIKRFTHHPRPPPPQHPPTTPTTPQPPHQPTPTPTNPPAPPKHKATVSIPYHRGTSEMIGRALRKADVGVISNNKNSLRTQLVHLKDPIPHTHKSSVVYHIPCAGSNTNPCDATYIGETERSMDTRFKEHHNKSKSKIEPLTDKYASAVGQHARTTGHHFRPEDVTYLDRESDKMARGIKEAIYTRALNPALNKGGGLRYILPATDDTVINTTVKPPKPPPPSAPGLPPPAFDISLPKPKGRQPGAKNVIKCLPLVDAAIKAAAQPTTTQPPSAPPTATRRPGRPRKDATANNSGTVPPATTANTALLALPPHGMTTRARTLRSGDRDALSSPPATRL